jgi:hypothetical protein
MKTAKKLLIKQLEEQQKRNRDKANFHKRCFRSYWVMMIILGVLNPLSILVFEMMNLSRDLTGLLVVVITVLIMLVALINLWQSPQRKWKKFRLNEENLKKEKCFYEFRLGNYTALEQHEADALLKIALCEFNC